MTVWRHIWLGSPHRARTAPGGDAAPFCRPWGGLEGAPSLIRGKIPSPCEIWWSQEQDMLLWSPGLHVLPQKWSSC